MQSFSEQLGLPGTQPGVRDGYQHQSQTYRGFGQQHQQQSPSPLPSPAAAEYFNPQPPYHGYFNHLGNYYYSGAKPTSQLQQQQQQQQQQQPTGLSGYGLSLDSTFPGQYSSESMVQWRGPRSTPLSFPVYEQDRFGGPFSPPPPSFQPSSGGSSVNRSLQQQHSGGPLSLGPQSPSPSPLSQRSPLPHHQAAPLPHHQAAPLPHHQATPLPHHQATPLPHHQAAPLPHQQATPLPHHQPGPHSHHSTSIQQHLAQPTVQLQQQQQQQQPQQPTSPQYNQSGLPFSPHYQPHSSTSFPTQSYSPKYHSLSVAQYDSQVSGFCGGSFGSSSTLFNYQQGTVLQGFEQPSSPQKQQQQISSQANATLSQTPNQVGLYSSLELSVKSPSQFHHQPFSPSSVPSPALQPVGRSPSYSSASASSPALQSPDPTHFLSGGIRGPMTQLLHSPSPSTSMSGGQYKPIPGVECHVSAEPNNSLDIGTERIQPKPATMASLDPSIVRLDVRRCLEAPIDSELNRAEREMPTACTQENSMALNLKVSPGCLDGRSSGDTSSGVGDVCSRLDSMSSLNALSSQVENIPKTVQQLLLSEALALHRRGGKRSPRRADASRERGSSTDSSVRSSCSSSPLATERLHALEEADSDKECLPKQNASLALKSESMDIIPVAWPVETTRTCSVISSDISPKDFLSDDSKAHSLAFPVHDEIKTKHIIGPDGNITRDIASKPCLDVASEDGLLDNQCVSIKDEASKIASDVTPFKCVRVISSPLEAKDNKDLRWAEQHLEDMQEAKYASNEQMRHAPQDSSGMLLQSKLETDNGKSHTEADCDASIINGDSGSVHQRSSIVSEVMENPPVVMKGSKREISKCRKQDVINLQNEVDVLGTKGPAVHGSVLKLTPLSTPPTSNRRSLRPNKKTSIRRDLDSKTACHQKPFTCTGGVSEASIQLQSFPSNSNLICNVDSSHSQYSEEVLRGSNNMVGPLKKLPGRNGGRLPTGTERRSYVRKPSDTVVSRRTSAANTNSPSVVGNAAQRHDPTNTASSSTPLEEIASARGITTMARRAGRQVPVVTERKLSRETTAVSRGSNQPRGSCSEQAVRRRRTSTMMEGDVKIDTSLLVSATCSSLQSNKTLGNLISEDSVLNTTRISPRRVGNVAFLQGVSDENRQQPHGKECEEKVNFTRPSTTDHRISPVTLSHVQEPVYRQQGSRRKQMPSLKQDASLTKRLEGKMGEAVPCPTGVNTYDATSKRKSREKTEATVKKQRIELEPNNLIQAEGNTKNCSNVHVRQTLFNVPNPGKTKILPPRKSRGLKLEEIVQKITSPKRLAPPNILEVTNNSASLEELLTGNSDVSEEQSAVGKERKPPRCSPDTLFNTSGENGGSVIQGVSVSLENRDLGRVAYPTGQALSLDGKLKQDSKVTTRIPSLPKENFLTLLKPNLPKPICSLLPISASVTTGRSENEHALPSSSHRPQLSIGSNHTSALTSVYTRPSSRGTTARLCNKAPAVQTSASNHTGRLRPVGPALGSIRAPVVVVPQATMPTVRFIDSLLDSRAGDTSNSASNKPTSSRKVSPLCIPALTSSKVANVSPSIKALPSNVVPVVRVPGVLTKDGKVDNIATALLNISHCKTKNLSSSCAVKEVSVISSPSKDRRKRSRGSGPKRGALSKKRNSRSKKSLLIMAQPDEPEIRLKSLSLKNEEKPESRVKYFSPYIRMQNNCRESIITIVNSQDDELKLEKPKSAVRSSIPKPMPQVLPSSSCVVIARVVTDAPNKGPLVCCICGFSANWKDLGDIFGPYYPQGYQPSRKNKPTDKECDLSKVVEERVERVEETSHEMPRSCLTEAENESRGRRRSSCQGKIRRDSNSVCPPGRGGLRGTRCRKPTCYCCREGLEGGGSSSTGAVDPRSRKAKVEGATKEVGVIVSPVTTVETSQPPEVPLDCQEYWVHCACAVWTGEVFLIAGRLYGLKEAVEMAQETSCTRCGQSGASLGCNFKGCLQRYHFVCASEAECLLCEENFTMKCAKHKGKMLLAAADSLEKR